MLIWLSFSVLSCLLFTRFAVLMKCIKVGQACAEKDSSLETKALSEISQDMFCLLHFNSSVSKFDENRVLFG